MIRKRLGRLAIVFTSAALASMMLGTGVVSARNPTWDVQFDKLPTSVGAGHSAGWLVKVINNGPSNINDLNITLTSEVDGQLPSYLEPVAVWVRTTDTLPSCDAATGKMVCALGTVGDDQYVIFTVAFLVPAGTTGSFDLNVGLRAGTGDTGSDGGSSRGDDKTFTSSTGISQNQNYDGGFTVGASSFATTGNLGRNNKVTTTLDLTDLHFPVTITDDESSFPCTGCSNFVGLWSRLDVDGGKDHAIKVTLMVWGGSVPGGIGASDLKLIHANGDGTYTTLTLADNLCDATHSNADCLVSITKVGNNFKFVAWLKKNGAIRGTF